MPCPVLSCPVLSSSISTTVPLVWQCLVGKRTCCEDPIHGSVFRMRLAVPWMFGPVLSCPVNDIQYTSKMAILFPHSLFQRKNGSSPQLGSAVRIIIIIASSIEERSGPGMRREGDNYGKGSGSFPQCHCHRRRQSAEKDQETSHFVVVLGLVLVTEEETSTLSLSLPRHKERRCCCCYERRERERASSTPPPTKQGNGNGTSEEWE